MTRNKNRYACLVAEPAKEGDGTLMKPQKRYQQLVGVVDVTVLRDNDVLRHLQGADEYLYVSGIAVAHNFRFHTTLNYYFSILSVPESLTVFVNTNASGDRKWQQCC